MTNQVPLKRKASISPPNVVTPTSENHSSKRQRIEYPIFTAPADRTPSPTSSPSSPSPYKKALPFRCIPPTHPQRCLPTLYRRRQTRYAQIERSKFEVDSGIPIHPSWRAIFNAPIISTGVDNNSYEQYLRELLMQTPKWLRDERLRPRIGTWDEVARTPTSVRLYYMSKEEFRIWKREDTRARKREKTIWHGFCPTGMKETLAPVKPQVIAETVTAETVIDEEKLGSQPEKSSTCRLQ